MILGSHNTMSYLKPQWWMRPFAFMARCQSEDLETQWNRGVRMFDLRIVFENGIPYFAHGLATYKGIKKGTSTYPKKVVEYVLTWLNIHASLSKEKVIVRVINERNKDEVLFEDFCNKIDETYKYLQFCGFRNKNSKGYFNHWTIREAGMTGVGDTGAIGLVYKDPDKFCSVRGIGYQIKFIDKYSSDNCDKHNHCTGSWLDDWCPWIYAKLFNRKWRDYYKDYDGILLQDFVGQF